MPKHKRHHGYFVLPILFGESFVGRLDPKADRTNKTLIIRRLAIEPGFISCDCLVPELGRASNEFARFNGCESVRLETVEPTGLMASLKKALAGC